MQKEKQADKKKSIRDCGIGGICSVVWCGVVYLPWAEKMEGDNVGGGTPASSRWNPTKEQIGMLESLYMQGIRTPSADQIQQITGRLKAYGHIEGKNVFYWFQNHKARQRQKQKQESMAYVNRYLHNTSPLFPPPCPNVVCAPYYVSQSDLGFYPQYPKVLLPGGIKRRPRTERVEKTKPRGGDGGGGGYEIMMQAGGNNEGLINSSSIDCNPETLPLFPLHPTGDLQRRQSPPTSAQNSATLSTSSETDGSSSDQHLFDFFPTPSSSTI